MANPFDAFDDATRAAANPFDSFDAPKAPQPEPLPAGLANRLIEGQDTTFRNGITYSLRDGVPVRVDDGSSVRTAAEPWAVSTVSPSRYAGSDFTGAAPAPPAEPIGFIDALGEQAKAWLTGRVAGVAQGLGDVFRPTEASSPDVQRLLDVVNPQRLVGQVLQQEAAVGRDVAAAQTEEAAPALGARPTSIGDAFLRPENTARYYAGQAVPVLGDVALATLTRNPRAAAEVAGGLSGVSTYSDVRGEGANAFQAAQEAVPAAILERGGSRPGFEAAFDPARTLLQRAGTAIAREVANEAPVAGLQAALPAQTGRKDVPLSDVLGAIADATVLSAASGGGEALLASRGPAEVPAATPATNPFDEFDAPVAPEAATVPTAPELTPLAPTAAADQVPSPPVAGEVQSPATPLSPAANPATADDVTQTEQPLVPEQEADAGVAAPEPAPAAPPEISEPITQPAPEPQISTPEIVERTTPGGKRFQELSTVRRAVDAAEQTGRAGDLMRSIEQAPILSEDQRWLAGKLAPIMDSLDVKMVRATDSEDAGGYNNVDNTLHVQQAVPSVALHESLHGATSALLTNPVARQNPTVRQVVGEFDTMLAELQAHVRDGTVQIPARIQSTINNPQGPLSNIKELLTYGMTEKPFQQYLRSLPAPAGIQARNLWEAFKGAIAKLLGANTPAQRTFLDQLIESGGALVDFAAENPAVARAAQRGEADRITESQRRVAAPPAPAPAPAAPAPAPTPHPVAKPTTSTKNRVTEVERAARGEDPILREAAKSNESTLEDAKAALRENPSLPAEVISRLRNEGAPAISTTEEAALLVEKVRLMNARDGAAKRASDERLTPEQRAIAKQQWEQAEIDMNEIDQATVAAGRQWGRFGQFRQRLLRQDYTLESLERRERVARGRPLTQVESAEIKKLADQIAGLQRSLEEAQRKNVAETQSEGVRTAIESLRKRAGTRSTRRPRVEALRERAEAARRTLRAVGPDPAMISGVDPAELQGTVDPELRNAAVDIGALRVAEGDNTLDKFKAAMQAELGDRYADIEPGIASIYADATSAATTPRESPENVVEDIEGDQPTHRDVSDVALAVIRKGVRGEEAIVSATTEAIAERFPEWEDADTRTALGETGRAEAPTRAEDREVLRELKTLVRLQEQIDTLQAGLERKPAGKRRKASIEVQQRRDELNALLRAADERSGANDARRQALRDMRVRNLRNSIAALHQQIESGNRPQKRGKRKADAEEAALIEKRSALQKQLRQLDAAARPRKDPAETYQRRRGTGIARQIDQIEARIAAGDYTPRARVQRTLNEANQKAAFELDKAKQRFRERQFQIELEQRSRAAKFLDNTASGINMARAIQTGLDLSAIGRQGAIQLLSHPVRTLRTVPTMLRAAFSPTQAHATMEKLRARPNWPEYQKAGVFFAEEGGSLSKLEEAYMSRWLQHNDYKPGEPVRNVGRAVKNVALAPFRASGRAYSTALNVIRADAYDALKATLSKDGENLSPAEQKAIGNFVNVTTGRGKIGVNDDAGTVINTLFFAPRLVSSRFQYLLGAPLLGGSAKTRKLIAQEYARFAAGAAIVYGLGAFARGESDEDDDRPFIESDPRSSIFGRFRFGDTYLEPTGGLTQVATLLSRILSGETKTNAGEIQPLRPGNRLTNGLYEIGNMLEAHGYDRLGNMMPQEPNYDPVGSGASELSGTIGDYLRYKLSPVASATLNTVTGKNPVGQPTTAAQEAGSLVTPMIFGNAADVVREQGALAGTAITAAEVFGAGVQRRDRSSFAAPDYGTLSFDQRQKINEYERVSSKAKQNVEQLRKLAASFPRDTFAGDIEASVMERADELGIDGVSLGRYAAGGKKTGLKRNPSGSVQMEFAPGSTPRAVIDTDKAVGKINKAISTLISREVSEDEIAGLAETLGVDLPEDRVEAVKALGAERERLIDEFMEMTK
jgi:hypothetical protein